MDDVLRRSKRGSPLVFRFNFVDYYLGNFGYLLLPGEYSIGINNKDKRSEEEEGHRWWFRNFHNKN